MQIKSLANLFLSYVISWLKLIVISFLNVIAYTTIVLLVLPHSYAPANNHSWRSTCSADHFKRHYRTMIILLVTFRISWYKIGSQMNKNLSRSNKNRSPWGADNENGIFSYPASTRPVCGSIQIFHAYLISFERPFTNVWYQ